MRILIFLLVTLLAAGTIDAQPRRGGKVKRKYRQVDAVRQDLPEVFVHGRVLNQDRMPLVGATVTVPGMRLGVHTNGEGRYFLRGLPTGKVSIMVSYTGYKTKIIDYYLQEVNNDVYFTLDEDRVALEAAPVTLQVLEQHLLEIPASATTFSKTFTERNNFRQLTDYLQFVPGVVAIGAEPVQPFYSVRGIHGNGFSPENSPAMAFRMNNVPINRGIWMPTRLYDMERVEVMNGPAGTLYGADAFMGVVNMVTRKPESGFSGFASASYGSFGGREAEGALNIPIYKNFVIARASGVYYRQDGYVENISGENLNGANMAAGRVMLRIIPYYRTQIDLEFNYQNDRHSGVAWVSKNIPGTDIENGIFNTPVSTDWGDLPGTQREAMGGSLQLRHYKNGNNYLTTISSWSNGKMNLNRDGDGLPIPVIGTSESQNVKQLMQEVRYSFSRRSRTNGIVGIKYLNEELDHSLDKQFNEQYLGRLFMNQPIIGVDGTFSPLIALPNDSTLGILSGATLPINHGEGTNYLSSFQSVELYADAAFRIRPRLTFTAGLRGTAGMLKVSGDAYISGGEPSVIGKIGPNRPGLEYKSGSRPEVTRRFISPSLRVGLKHDFNSVSNVFLGYSYNKRLPVVRFESSGFPNKPVAEKIQSMEAGFKVSVLHRFWIDATFFYQMYGDFNAIVMDTTLNMAVTKDTGKSTGYGTELKLKAAILKGLDFFGNYSYLNSTVGEKDRNGDIQILQGHQFGYAPKHAFDAGIWGRINLAHDILVFMNPAYSWNSGYWFDEANIQGFNQDSYGIFNVVAGVELSQPSIVVSASAYNVLNYRYVKSVDRGNENFGFVTYVPGSPRILGLKIKWNF